MTLTVPEAARRIGRNPETVRRWIREGKLRAHKVGTQHFIDEPDLDAVTASPDTYDVPATWRRTLNGEPMPDWVALVRQSRTRR